MRCIQCRKRRNIGPGEVPKGEHPMCDKCFMPMVAVSATAAPLRDRVEKAFREDSAAGRLAKFDCPFCSGSYQVPPSDSPVIYVVHSVPMCERYDKLHPVEFLAAARRKIGVPMPWDEEN